MKSVHLELPQQPYKKDELQYLIQDIHQFYSSLEDVFNKFLPQINEVVDDNYANIGSENVHLEHGTMHMVVLSVVGEHYTIIAEIYEECSFRAISKTL